MSAPDAAAPREVRWRRRAGGGAKKLFAWAVILGLAALALVLLSERNARTFTLELEDGSLVVKKGILFPVGSRSFAPADPRLAQAYGPIVPPPKWAPPRELRLDGREELDQALFEHLARWARDDVASVAPDRLARGMAYIERAELLPGISTAQRQELDGMRADAGFFVGRDLVARSADDLRRARERLARTARSASAHAGEANEAIRELEQALEALHRATRALGGAAPGGAPPPEAAAAAPPAAGGDAPAPGSPAPATAR